MQKLDIITKTLAVLMFILGILFLIVKFDYVKAFEFIGGSVASIFFFYLLDKMKINHYYKIFIVVAIWAHLIGALSLFDNFVYYDKILHFTIAVFITLIISDYFYSNFSFKNGLLQIFIFFNLLGIFAGWEIYEYIGDVLFNLHAQGVYDFSGNIIVSRIDDTMQDMIISSIGAIITLFIRNGRKDK
jgi:hypothetical protein